MTQQAAGIDKVEVLLRSKLRRDLEKEQVSAKADMKPWEKAEDGIASVPPGLSCLLFQGIAGPLVSCAPKSSAWNYVTQNAL
jgi:hypothetical protein